MAMVSFSMVVSVELKEKIARLALEERRPLTQMARLMLEDWMEGFEERTVDYVRGPGEPCLPSVFRRPK